MRFKRIFKSILTKDQSFTNMNKNFYTNSLLREKVRIVEGILKDIRVPGYNVDILSSGLINRIRISFDGKRVLIFINYMLSAPSCNFCRFINNVLWNKILNEIKSRLSENFNEVIFLDATTGAKIEI